MVGGFFLFILHYDDVKNIVTQFVYDGGRRYNVERGACLMDESFMFKPFGHFRMVQFGKSVSFDVSIFVLVCIVYFVCDLNA